MIVAESSVEKIKFPCQRKRIEANPECPEFGQQCVSTCFDRKNTSSNAYKRRPEGLVDGSGTFEKKPKMVMNRLMTQRCSALLEALKKHPTGRFFDIPSDIPDYFIAVRNPMDLHTIKSNLAKNTYLGVEDFEGDIRLAFYNAMHYRHPCTNFLKMAEELKRFLHPTWKSLKENWNHEENLMVGDEETLSMRLKDGNGSRQSCSKTQLCRNSFFPKKLKPCEFQEKASKVPLNARAAEVEFPKPAQNCVGMLARKDSQKGASNGRHVHGCTNVKPPLSQGARKCSSWGSIKCQCSLPSDSNHASSRVVSSERSLDGDLRVCSAVGGPMLDCQEKCKLTSQMSKSDTDFNGVVPVSTLEDEKALRAAMLKSRFADAIFKAQLKMLHVHGDKADPVKMQQEKEKLERRQREEKAKIEAQIRTAEAAAKVKAEVELKKQRKREREREAARIALQKMEKTAGIELNLEIFKELKILSGGSLSHGNPLHQLGLFIKDEYLEDEDDYVVLNEDIEEGEIVC